MVDIRRHNAREPCTRIYKDHGLGFSPYRILSWSLPEKGSPSPSTGREAIVDSISAGVLSPTGSMLLIVTSTIVPSSIATGSFSRRTPRSYTPSIFDVRAHPLMI